jgi:hypothetical protein
MQVKDLTTEELKVLIRETVTQTLVELLANQREQTVSQKAIVAQQQKVVKTETQGTSQPSQEQSPPSPEDSQKLDIPVRETAKELGLFINKD